MKLLHKNALSGVGQLVLTAALTFFSVPVFIRTLGDEAYGAFSIVTLIGNLNIFANLGLNTALLQSLSIQGKSKQSDYDIAITFGLLLAIMVPLSVLAITQRAYILQGIMGLSGNMYERITMLYVCVILANLLLLLGQTFTTVLDSQQRNYLTNYYQLVYSVMYWGGIILLISLGYDMAEIGVLILNVTVVWFMLTGLAAWRTWGELQLKGIEVNIGLRIKKQLTFSAKVYSAGLLTMLFEPLTKLLVARLIGIREVGYLEIAYKIRTQLWALATKVLYPLYPKIAKETDKVRLGQLISNCQSTVLMLITPFLLFFLVALPDLLRLWLHIDNTELLAATLVISTTFLINTLSIPPYLFLMSRHVSKTVWIQMFSVVINGVIILTTYQVLGFYGIILGNSLAILGSLGLSLFYQKKYVGTVSIGIIAERNLFFIFLIVGSLAYLVGNWLNDPTYRIIISGLSTLFLYAILLRSSYSRLKFWSA